MVIMILMKMTMISMMKTIKMKIIQMIMTDDYNKFFKDNDIVQKDDDYGIYDDIVEYDDGDE